MGLEFLQAIPFDQLLIQTVNVIVTGMILALVASGLTLIFGIMDVVNFAHGELFMLGAYVGVVVMAGTGNFWVALILSTLTVAMLGAGPAGDRRGAAGRHQPCGRHDAHGGALCRGLRRAVWARLRVGYDAGHREIPRAAGTALPR